jgi:hypothetical protein
VIKKMAALVTLAAAVGMAATLAQAGTSKSHHFSEKGAGNGIYHAPFVGAANTSAWAGTLAGNGAIIEKWNNPASSCSGNCPFDGTVRVFGPKGSFGGTITAGTVNGWGEQGPPQGVTEQVKVTAGTGLYKRAKGTVTVTHTLITGSPGIYTVAVRGTIKY